MSQELTHSPQQLREQAAEALERGDFQGAVALAENAQETEELGKTDEKKN